MKKRRPQQDAFLSVRRQPNKRVRRAKRGTRLFVSVAVAFLVTTTAGAYMPSWTSSPAPRVLEPSRLHEAPQTLADYDQALRQLDDGENNARAELEAVNKRLGTVDARMVARGRAYYRLVRAGLLPVGGGFDGLVDHATRIERLRTALKRDITLQKKLASRQEELATELERIERERTPLRSHRSAMKRAESAMQQADERRAAFDRAFRGSSEAVPPHMAIYGGDGPIDTPATSAFEKLRGRLSFPLAGRAELLMPAEPVDGPTGVTLIASRDTAVSSVYPGRVAFTGPTEHGTTVVLDHGEHYFSLYGRLQRLEVRVGDAVPERGRLGWVSRQGPRAPKLYFELRRADDVLDAATWLGL